MRRHHAFVTDRPDFTGISAPYEAPPKPEIHIRTDQGSVDDGVKQMVAYVRLTRAMRADARSCKATASCEMPVRCREVYRSMHIYARALAVIRTSPALGTLCTGACARARPP